MRGGGCSAVTCNDTCDDGLLSRVTRHAGTRAGHYRHRIFSPGRAESGSLRVQIPSNFQPQPRHFGIIICAGGEKLPSNSLSNADTKQIVYFYRMVNLSSYTHRHVCNVWRVCWSLNMTPPWILCIIDAGLQCPRTSLCRPQSSPSPNSGHKLP